MQKKKSHTFMIVFLWIVFVLAVLVISYLSFQDGEESKLVFKKLIQYIADKKYQGSAVSEEDITNLTYEIRQIGRVVLFFFLGILGTVTIHISFRKRNWFLRTGITAVILVSIACLTEKLKVYIPSRHYSYEEMMYSIMAVSAGFLLVSVITLLFQVFKNFFRLISTAAQ